MRNTLIIILMCGALACSKSEDKNKTEQKPVVAEKTPEELAAEKAAAEKAAAEKAAKEKEEEERKAQLERLAKTRQEDEEEAKQELERWTDDLRAKVKKLAEADYSNVKKGLTTILKSPHRMPGHADRDKYRHPVETLMFFGIKPNMTVVEVGAGGGWYTEILAPFLAKKGKLVITSPDPNGPPDKMGTIRGLRIKAMLDKSPELYGKVVVAMVDSASKKFDLGAPGSADLVLAIREMHNWQQSGILTDYLQAIHQVLKPGGVLGVVQHRAKPDANAEESAKTGYLPEAWLVEQIEAVGFKLEAKSEINANPKDTKDYEEGVWTLPPNFQLGDKDREKYAAIGESDRMTLKFVKVEPKAGSGDEAEPETK